MHLISETYCVHFLQIQAKNEFGLWSNWSDPVLLERDLLYPNYALPSMTIIPKETLRQYPNYSLPVEASECLTADNAFLELITSPFHCQTQNYQQMSILSWLWEYRG